MTATFLLLLVALLCFTLAAGGAPGISWRDAGFAFVTAAFLAGQLGHL